jgi:hypothetical protein
MAYKPALLNGALDQVVKKSKPAATTKKVKKDWLFNPAGQSWRCAQRKKHAVLLVLLGAKRSLHIWQQGWMMGCREELQHNGVFYEY